jgi:hypothetical protein
MMPGRFSLGEVVITARARACVPDAEVMKALHLHCQADWGDLTEDDRVTNEQALLEGDRLFSAYRSLKGEKFYIITEADRSVTTILLPEEY